MGRVKAKYPTGSFILKYKKADKDARLHFPQGRDVYVQ
jgi:hypothetical protein